MTTKQIRIDEQWRIVRVLEAMHVKEFPTLSLSYVCCLPYIDVINTKKGELGRLSECREIEGYKVNYWLKNN